MSVSTEPGARDTSDMMQKHYDVVVIGGGPAGLSGAKMLARSRRSVLVIDAGAPRNLPAEGVHNYLYVEGRAPGELTRIGRAEARRYGVEVVDGTATAAAATHDNPNPKADRFAVEVTTGAGHPQRVGARRLLLATGLVDGLPDIPGLRERWGIDVLHCPFCHGWEVRDQAIGVIGTSPLALHQLLLFRQLSADVVYFQHTAPDPTDDQREQLTALGIQHVAGEVAEVVTTDGALSGLRMSDGHVLARQAVAVASTVNGRADLLADLGLFMTDLVVGDLVAGRFLVTDPSGLTPTPGVWAAGNVVSPMAQVINSAAAGGTAGAMIHLDLITEDTTTAVTALRKQEAAPRSNVNFSRAEAGPASAGSGKRPHDHPATSPLLDSATPASGYVGDPQVQAEWDKRYADQHQLWSGQPNGALVAEVAALTPGRVLDVGCGEGADAVWLARQGWEVTGLEVSGVALERAAQHARDAGVTVGWQHAGLAEAALPPASFDLVSAQYPALLRTADAAAERALLAAVAPGGVLLLVHHAGMDTHSVHDSGFDPADYVWPAIVIALLDDDWQVEVNEQRPRIAPQGGAGAHHTDDLVLRARRRR